MGNKYMALCYSYPPKGYAERSIQSDWFLPFMIKIIKASFKYRIIDINYRNF